MNLAKNNELDIFVVGFYLFRVDSLYLWKNNGGKIINLEIQRRNRATLKCTIKDFCKRSNDSRVQKSVAQALRLAEPGVKV